jgi:hypothetical protein
MNKLKLLNHVIKGQRFYIHKIIDVSYRKRSFCILDRDLEYELTVTYKQLTAVRDMDFALGLGFIGYIFTDTVRPYNDYKIRLSSLEECEQNISDIDRKKEIRSKFLEQIIKNAEQEIMNGYLSSKDTEVYQIK